MAVGVEELLSHPLLWRGQEAGLNDTPAIATGFEALDRYLPGGGWPLAGISEIFVEHYGLGELRVLMPALAALSRRAVESKQWIVWIAPPFVPYAPALAHHGVDLSRILLVHPPRKRDVESAPSAGRAGRGALRRVPQRPFSGYRSTSLERNPKPHATTREDCLSRSAPLPARPAEGADSDSLWAVEQAIRSHSSAATLAWVREADVTALRRLQLGAEAHRCWTVLFRSPEAMTQSSPAALRFRLLPGGGQAGIRIDIQKCRGRKPRSFLL